MIHDLSNERKGGGDVNKKIKGSKQSSDNNDDEEYMVNRKVKLCNTFIISFCSTDILDISNLHFIRRPCL